MSHLHFYFVCLRKIVYILISPNWRFNVNTEKIKLQFFTGQLTIIMKSNFPTFQ